MNSRFSYLLFIFALFLTSCGMDKHPTITPKKKEIYVIENNKNRDTLEQSLETALTEFYSDYNIILIDSLSNIYYHKKQFFCFTGYEYNNDLPYFQYLNPDLFFNVENADIMCNIILNDSIKPERVFLISNKDTISDKRYFKIKKFLIDNKTKVSTRLITEEEMAIMTSIILNKKYTPENIIWKNTLAVPDFKNLE